MANTAYITYTDAIEALKVLGHEKFRLADDFQPYINALVDACDRIEAIPSADVAEVVRCKDCKNNYVTTHNHGKQDDPRCDFTDRHLSLDDFCSRGERRMDGGT